MSFFVIVCVFYKGETIKKLNMFKDPFEYKRINEDEITIDNINCFPIVDNTDSTTSKIISDINKTVNETFKNFGIPKGYEKNIMFYSLDRNNEPMRKYNFATVDENNGIKYIPPGLENFSFFEYAIRNRQDMQKWLFSNKITSFLGNDMSNYTNIFCIDVVCEGKTEEETKPAKSGEKMGGGSMSVFEINRKPGHTISGTFDKDNVSITATATDEGMNVSFEENDELPSLSPFIPYNIFIPLIDKSNPIQSDIYLLRQKTPDFILSKIQDNYDNAYKALNIFLHIDEKEKNLIRIGYFKFEYDGTNLLVSIFADPRQHVTGFNSVHVGSRGKIDLMYLNAGQFNGIMMDPDFSKLFTGLVEKTMYELFIRKNSNTDIPFTQYLSMDLYPERSKDANTVHMFHVDATDEMPTSLFTLMYLMPPDVKIKGPTIVTKSSLEVRNQATLIVENGTIIGVDNRVMLHATSDSIVRIFEEDSITPLPPVRQEHGNFSLYTPSKKELIDKYIEDNIFNGEEVVTDEDGNILNYEELEQKVKDKISKDKETIEILTNNTTRKFVRTWYLDGYKTDKPYSLMNLPFNERFQIDMDSIKEVISIFNNGTTTIIIDHFEEPDIILSLYQVQESSLGGGKRGITGGVRVSGQTQGIAPSSQDNSLLERNKFLLNSLSSNEKTENQPTNPKGSITMLESFSELFNKVCNGNFIIKQSAKPIITRIPNKGGKKFKNYNFLKYMKTKKYRKTRKSRRHLKTKNRRHLKTKSKRQLKIKSKRHLKTKNKK